MRNTPDARTEPVYSGVARFFHWLTVVLVFILVPLGFLMTYRGKTLDVWDATTNALYSTHKILGIALLGVVVLRLIYRFAKGAPPDEVSIEPWQKAVSHVTHWTLYGLLIAMPIIGWIGVSKFPALDIFGLFKLPALTEPDNAGAAAIFEWHVLGAYVLIGLVGMHVAAALYHHCVRKDGVLRRMLPGLSKRV
jgi:cytochrome b561